MFGVWHLRLKNTSTAVQMQHEVLRHATTWFNANQLSLNRDKIVFYMFTLRNNTFATSSTARFLDFHIDASLTWITHTSKFVSKLSTNVFLLNLFDELAFRTLYFSLFECNLTNEHKRQIIFFLIRNAFYIVDNFFTLRILLEA